MKQLEMIRLKNSAEYNEAWLQKQIAEDPSILGLGNLRLRAKEKILTYGRLDILLEDTDSDNPTRYEVEIQLGDTDESHIIRTIEYWDLERKRYPQYDHVAVLIAEGVTGRFLNVLNLFNGQIPLIVLKMDAFKVQNDIAIHFTRILDRVRFGLPEEDAVSEPANRAYWEKRSCPGMLKLADELFSIVKSVEADVVENYNKYYIGLLRNNVATNFCYFRPKKAFVYMLARCLDENSDLMRRLDEVNIEAEFKSKWNVLQLKFSQSPDEKQVALIREVVELAKKNYG